MAPRVDAIVVGAGVVGLAVARGLARAGHETIVVEQARQVGAHQSSRNSEVVHAGIYYPPGSFKARLCVEGRALLYRYAAARGIGHRRCGKLIVATTPGEVPALARIERRARDAGVDDLQRLDAAQVGALEPEVRSHAALLSPSTGIVDSHALLAALQSDLEDAGGSVVLDTPVVGIHRGPQGLVVRTGDDEVEARRVVNAGGLFAQTLARATEGLSARHVPPRAMTKGTYFTIHGHPFGRLVYPVPDTASLGIHVTLDLAGACRFGPDQEWIEGAGEGLPRDLGDDLGGVYDVDPTRAQAFYPSIRRFWPALPDGALVPAYAGVRAKVQQPGEPMADFVISDPSAHGIVGLVNLFGIESPGLTSCLAMAAEVLRRLDVDPSPALPPA